MLNDEELPEIESIIEKTTADFVGYDLSVYEQDGRVCIEIYELDDEEPDRFEYEKCRIFLTTEKAKKFARTLLQKANKVKVRLTNEK